MMNKSRRRFLSFALAGLFLLMNAVFMTGVSADLYEKNMMENTVRTVESEVMLCGEERPGTSVAVEVYNYPQSSRARTTLYAEQFYVGESGMYMISVPLPVLGEQFLSVSINSKGKSVRYYRYERNLGRVLTETYLNVYDFLSEEP